MCLLNLRKIVIRYLVSETESHSAVSDSLWPRGLYSPWNPAGQNTGVGSLSLRQGIFPTQGLNPGLPHCRQILYQLSHKGTLKRTVKLQDWVAASKLLGLHTHTPCSHCFYFHSSHNRTGFAWRKPFPKQCTSGQCWFVSYVPRLTCNRKSREISAEFSFLIFEHILRCSQNCFLPDPSAIGGKELGKSDVPSPSTVRISILTPQGLGQQAPLQSLYITMSTVVFSFWTWR